MKAAWYERQGPAADVLVVGQMPDPEPGPGEVRIRTRVSAVHPGDVKKRQDSFGVGMPFPRVIPHSDGAGTIDRVGAGVAATRVGERVWCFGAQSYRAFGTAAEYVVVPSSQAIVLPDRATFEQGACLGIPGITADRAVHVAGPVRDRVVLVQGGAGAVGRCAVALARQAGASVVATVRAPSDVAVAQRAGAQHVVCTEGLAVDDLVARVLAPAPDGVDHIVEVAFDANVAVDELLLRQGGSIATYATGGTPGPIPFWPLVFKNVGVFFLGSDDFSAPAKAAAAARLTELLAAGWAGLGVEASFALDEVAAAHAAVETRRIAGPALLRV